MKTNLNSDYASTKVIGESILMIATLLLVELIQYFINSVFIA